MTRRTAERAAAWRMPSFDGPAAGIENDVVVIGAGIGSLTSAALLAQRGLRVLVLEQQARAGGYCCSWRRNTQAGTFVFDAGVHDISGLGVRGPVRNLLQQLRAEQELTWLRVRHEVMVDGGLLKVPPEPAAFVSTLGQRFPSEREGIARLFAELEALYREMYADVERTGGVPCPPRTSQERLSYARRCPTLVRWLERRFGDLLAAFVGDARLQSVLLALSCYLTDDPRLLTVEEMVPLFGYYFEGGFYPLGGSQSLTDTLVGALRRFGGRLEVRTPVRAIRVGDGRVLGVETADGSFHSARVVISGADVRRTLLELVGDAHLAPVFAAKLRQVTPSPSGLSVFLGLDVVPELGALTVLPGLGTIAVPSKLDPSLAPSGHASMTVLQLLPAKDACGWERQSSGYEQRKGRVGDELIQVVEQLMPSLRRHIIYREEASPATFARYTGATDGAIYGSARGQWRPSAQAPVEGLLMVGAGVFPGAGIEGVVISGTLAADAIRPVA